MGVREGVAALRAGARVTHSWSCKRMGVFRMGLNPRQGVPLIRRTQRESVAAGKMLGACSE